MRTECKEDPRVIGIITDTIIMDLTSNSGVRITEKMNIFNMEEL